MSLFLDFMSYSISLSLNQISQFCWFMVKLKVRLYVASNFFCVFKIFVVFLFLFTEILDHLVDIYKNSSGILIGIAVQIFVEDIYKILLRGS